MQVQGSPHLAMKQARQAFSKTEASGSVVSQDCHADATDSS